MIVDPIWEEQVRLSPFPPFSSYPNTNHRGLGIRMLDNEADRLDFLSVFFSFAQLPTTYDKDSILIKHDRSMPGWS
jgi:hypothetical protein